MRIVANRHGSQWLKDKDSLVHKCVYRKNDCLTKVPEKIKIHKTCDRDGWVDVPNI